MNEDPLFDGKALANGSLFTGKGWEDKEAALATLENEPVVYTAGPTGPDTVATDAPATHEEEADEETSEHPSMEGPADPPAETETETEESVPAPAIITLYTYIKSLHVPWLNQGQLTNLLQPPQPSDSVFDIGLWLAMLSSGVKEGGYMDASEAYGYWVSSDTNFNFLINSVMSSLSTDQYVELTLRSGGNYQWSDTFMDIDHFSDLHVFSKSFETPNDIIPIPCNTRCTSYNMLIDAQQISISVEMGARAWTAQVSVAIQQGAHDTIAIADYYGNYHSTYKLAEAAFVQLGEEETESMGLLYGKIDDLADGSITAIAYLNERWAAMANEVLYVSNVRRDIFKRVQDPLKLSLNNFGSMGAPESVVTLTSEMPIETRSGDIINDY